MRAMAAMPKTSPLVVALLLGALLVAAAPAQAHAGHGGFNQTKPAGPYYISIEVPDAPFPLAGTPLTLAVSVSNLSDWSPVEVERLDAVLTGPQGQTVEVPAFDDEGAVHSAKVEFPSKGAWTATVTVDGNVSADFSFEVYGPSPYQVTMVEDLTSGIYVVGRPLRAEFDVTTVRNSLPGPEVPDATARVEWWNEDHTQKLGEKEVPVQPAGKGRLVLETTLDEVGMYHVVFRAPSLEIDYGDRPYTHLYAVTPERARELGILEEDQNALPVPGGALAAAATALAALALGGRRRSR